MANIASWFRKFVTRHIVAQNPYEDDCGEAKARTTEADHLDRYRIAGEHVFVEPGFEGAKPVLARSSNGRFVSRKAL